MQKWNMSWIKIAQHQFFRPYQIIFDSRKHGIENPYMLLLEIRKKKASDTINSQGSGLIMTMLLYKEPAIS